MGIGSRYSFFYGGSGVLLVLPAQPSQHGIPEQNQHHAQHLKHHEISRLVENIPNGIITVTETDNEELRSSIIDHVTLMVTRLQEEKNPQTPHYVFWFRTTFSVG